MAKLKERVVLETTFGSYEIDEVIGEGGAGRVYGGVGPEKNPVAVKVLSQERASTDKRRRFKNEIAFLSRNTHPNIVTVLDHGLSQSGPVTGPFYVMKKYEGNLRNLIGTLLPNDVLPLFSQILDGVEAAHLKNVAHRDLKPENILLHNNAKSAAIADFGIANFTEELLITKVETQPTQRLANFMYAAPEQRVMGGNAALPADIYALGLILNEMFTTSVPHGTGYRLIDSASKDFGYLDALVARMINQQPGARPSSIAEVKALIQRYHLEAVSQQRLSNITNTVIKVGVIDEPLAYEPPKVVGGEWQNGTLSIQLDRVVNQRWIDAFRHIGNYTSVMGIPPPAFSFRNNVATVQASSSEAQRVIDFFKQWLPVATRDLKRMLEENAQREEAQRRQMLQQQRRVEEERIRANQSLKF